MQITYDLYDSCNLEEISNEYTEIYNDIIFYEEDRLYINITECEVPMIIIAFKFYLFNYDDNFRKYISHIKKTGIKKFYVQMLYILKGADENTILQMLSNVAGYIDILEENGFEIFGIKRAIGKLSFDYNSSHIYVSKLFESFGDYVYDLEFDENSRDIRNTFFNYHKDKYNWEKV